MSSSSDAPTEKYVDSQGESQFWDTLAERIDALIAAWEASTEAPPIRQFLPPAEPRHRVDLLKELIKVDLEYRWHRHFPKQVEDYLAEFPELVVDGQVPCDLVYEEYHIRRQAGDPITASDVFERFPQQVEELARLLELESPQQSTALTGRARPRKVVVGDRLVDFDLLTELGKGAFATVFLARQVSMQRMVALKVSNDRGSEPQTLAQLDHPNIVRVYDQREIPERQLRLLYMQYISGGTLQSVLKLRNEPDQKPTGKTFLAAIDRALDKRGESAPTGSNIRHRLEHATWPEVICWLGARLGQALAYAHARGVLHRDIKPANVLVAADGTPKLADFNISFSSKVEGATPAAYFGGSLPYMSPEQLEAMDPKNPRTADSLNGQTDIYSLGVMLWELLSGTRPFHDEMVRTGSKTLQEMYARRAAGVAPQIRRRLPANCPPGLEATLLRCLEVDVEKRFKTAAEVARAFELCLQPRAQKLVNSAPLWRQIAQKHPVPTLIAAGVTPNVILSGLNIQYNWLEIMKQLSLAAQNLFWSKQIGIVNSIAYPLGIGIVLWRCWPLLTAMRELAKGSRLENIDQGRLRLRSLHLGDTAALVTAALWVASGFAFMVWLEVETGKIPSHAFWHFVVSQVLWGLIATTMTFFLITAAAVRVYFTRLVALEPPETDEAVPLVNLGRRMWVYLGLTVAIPFVAVMLGPLTDVEKQTIAALAVAGLLASAIAFFMNLAIRSDLAALAAMIDPGGGSLAGGASDIIESTLLGSR